MSLKQLSANIKILRLRKGLSQYGLSELVGVCRTTCGHWERRHTIPNTECLVKLAKLFECSIDDLVRGDAGDVKKFEEHKWIMKTIKASK